MTHTPMNEQSIQEFLDRSRQFCQDDFNLRILSDYVRWRLRREPGLIMDDISIEDLAAYIKVNSEQFHWYRSAEELAKVAANAASAAVAAQPQPETKQPDRLKGLTMAERLGTLGITASPHVNHADKSEKGRNLLADMAKDISRMEQEKARRDAIEEARSATAWLPNGRVDHTGTLSLRRKKLAALGVKE
jgi:hypothetical protein